MTTTTKTKYPFAKGDIVRRFSTRRCAVVMSVGQFGKDITALVTWLDDGTHEHIPIQQLKKTLRPIEGGKADPDT